MAEKKITEKGGWEAQTHCYSGISMFDQVPGAPAIHPAKAHWHVREDIIHEDIIHVSSTPCPPKGHNGGSRDFNPQLSRLLAR